MRPQNVNATIAGCTRISRKTCRKGTREENYEKTAGAAAALATVSTMAMAERYVMIHTHKAQTRSGQLWKKGGRDAAAAIGAEFEYNFDPSGDMSGMAKLIEAAAASNPDGIIVSLPDADALGGAIRAAADAGIPVVTMNSGLESSAAVGALMHVGQPERLAGEKAGARAKAEGVTNAYV